MSHTPTDTSAEAAPNRPTHIIHINRSHASDAGVIEAMDALLAERDRLAAQVAQLQRDLDAANARAERAVKVKPLVWHENPDVGEGGFIARGLFGVAYHAMADGWNYYRRGLWADAKSLSDAKAAAQADYEARILSALEKPHD